MHRSGTSALTRSLLTLGVDLGGHLMEPMPEVNAKGFWEDMDIYQLNEEMLRAVGTQWYHSTPLTNAQIQALQDQGFLARAAALLQTKRPPEQPFAFKDPRLCRLLPVWQQVLALLGGEVAYILALRNPVSIADSLQKRDGMDRTHTYLMWLSHTLQSVIQSNGSRRVLVDFDRMLLDPKAQVRRVARGLGLTVEQEALEAYADDFLDGGLRHHVHAQGDGLEDPACPAMVTACYRELAAVAAGRKSLDSVQLQKRLHRWWQDLQGLRPLTQAMDRMLDRLQQ